MYVNTLNGYHLQKENHKIYKKKKAIAKTKMKDG